MVKKQRQFGWGAGSVGAGAVAVEVFVDGVDEVGG